MQIQTRRKDIIWNYIGIFFSMGSQVIWLPVLIHYLSPDLLGLWYVFVSIGGLVELLDSGFTPTLSHSMSYAWSGAEDLQKQGVVFSKNKKEPNYPLVCSIMYTCRKLYFGIALAASLLMISVGTVHIQHIAKSYLNMQVYAAWSLFILSTFINLYIGYYSVVLVGIGDVSNKNKANILSKAVFLISGSIGLIAGMGILGMSIAYFASGFVIRFLSKRYLIKTHHFDTILKNYKFQNQYSQKHILAMMWPNAWRDGLVTVSSYFTGQATVLLGSNFLSLYETGIYSFSVQVINAICSIANALFGAYLPAIQSAYVAREKHLMKLYYSKAMACFWHLSFWGITIFTIIGIPVVQFLRKDFVIDRLAFIVLAIYIYLLSRHRNSTSFIVTMNKLPYTFSFIFFGTISLGATYIGLAHFHLGLWGMILIPLAVQSLYNNWKWNMVVNRYLETNEWQLILDGTMDLIHGISRIVMEKLGRGEKV